MTIFWAILGLIFLIVIHELGHMLTAKAFGVRVPEFGVGFGPALFRRKFGKTFYSFRIILLGGFAKIAGMGDGEQGPDTYYEKAHWKRALIIFAGPAVNIVFTILLFAGLSMLQGVPTELEPRVSSVASESFASDTGIERGDRLVAIGGEKVSSWDGFTSRIESREPGEEVTLTVVRDGERRTFSGELGSAPGMPEQPLVGVTPTVAEVSHSPVLALGEGVKQTGTLIYLQASGIWQLVTGQIGFYENVSGPVGIASVGGEAVSQGLYTALTLLGIISLILGIMNLLPILPLDGGHLLFIALEKIIRRPISEEAMSKVAALGLVLILTLFVFATYADFSKILSGESFIPKN